MNIGREDNRSTRKTSPSYLRVRDWILDYISQHDLCSGDRIPSLRELSSVIGLSRSKTERAISELVEEGVLTRERRSGTFVAGKPSPTNSIQTIMAIRGGVVHPGTVLRNQTLFENMARGAMFAAKDADSRVMVYYCDSQEDEARTVSSLADHDVAGALVCPRHTDDAVRSYQSHSFTDPRPIVLFDHFFPSLPIDAVATDNFGAAKEAVSGLIAKGHRRIAFFTEFTQVTSVVERGKGYLAALTEAGIPYDEGLVCGPQSMPTTSFSFDFALEHLLRIPDPVTAVFGMNENSVWAALQAAQSQGLTVPGDLEIVGFFDSPIPDGVRTSFTRIVQPTFEIGQTAAKLLFERIAGKGPDEPQHILLPADIVE